MKIKSIPISSKVSEQFNTEIPHSLLMKLLDCTGPGTPDLRGYFLAYTNNQGEISMIKVANFPVVMEAIMNKVSEVCNSIELPQIPE